MPVIPKTAMAMPAPRGGNWNSRPCQRSAVENAYTVLCRKATQVIVAKVKLTTMAVDKVSTRLYLPLRKSRIVTTAVTAAQAVTLSWGITKLRTWATPASIAPC